MHYQRMQKHGEPTIKTTLKGEPLDLRFWSRVEKSDGCWLWTGARTADGYGRLWGIGREARAHRVSFEMHHGPIPDGLCVLHRCDNPPCCNPAHLFLGTTADNVADKIAKGRENLPARSGANHWMMRRPDRIARGSALSRLTEGDVAKIKARFSAGGITQRQLAERFGIGHKNLNLILNGKTWKHVSPAEKAK